MRQARIQRGSIEFCCEHVFINNTREDAQEEGRMVFLQLQGRVRSEDRDPGVTWEQMAFIREWEHHEGIPKWTSPLCKA